MAEEQLLADVIRNIRKERRSGALYISIVEMSEDLFRVYFEKGEIYHMRYGSASGKDCVDILEYYNFHSATYFDGIKAPGTPAKDLPSTDQIIAQFSRINQKIKVR